MNLADFVRLQAHARPHKPAIEYGGSVLNYADTWHSIVACARLLTAAGAQRGDRIGLSLRNHPAHVVAHYAVAAVGGAILPIDHRWSGAEKKASVAAFRPSLVVIDEDGEDIAGARCVRVGTSIEPATSDDGFRTPDRVSKPVLISMSSGTTGRPKGALVTHRQLYERFVTQWVTLGFNTTDRFVLVTPLFFGAGRSFAMSFLAAGATLIIDPPPHKGDRLRTAIAESDATATFLVPTAMRRLLELPGDEPMFGSLRRLLVSGEAFFETEVADFQRRLSSNLIGYYASSEGGGVSVLQPTDFDEHGGSVGQAAFGVEIEVVDAADKRLPSGEIGRLRYRGPGVTAVSLDEDGKEVDGHPDGWFYPGDLACISDDGYVTLCGREKDVIIRGGVNIYPAEIEQALMALPAVSEAAVLGAASDSHGEKIVAFVAAPRKTVPAEILEALSDRLAPYKLPADIRIVAELPKAGSGKVDKKTLARRLVDD